MTSRALTVASASALAALTMPTRSTRRRHGSLCGGPVAVVCALTGQLRVMPSFSARALKQACIPRERNRLPALQGAKVRVERIDQEVLGHRDNGARNGKNHGPLFFEPTGAEGAGGVEMGERVPVRRGGPMRQASPRARWGRDGAGERHDDLREPALAAQPHQFLQDSHPGCSLAWATCVPLWCQRPLVLRLPLPRKAVSAYRSFSRRQMVSTAGAVGDGEAKPATVQGYAGMPYSMW